MTRPMPAARWITLITGLPVAAVLTVLVATAATTPSLSQQETPAPGVATAAHIEVRPDELQVELGDSARLQAIVTDAEGNVLEDATVIFLSTASRRLGVTQEGIVQPIQPGTYTILARVPRQLWDYAFEQGPLLETRVRVHVPAPPIANIAFVDSPGRFYQGTTVRLETELTDTAGKSRDNVALRLESSNPSSVTIGEHQSVHMLAPGRATISARVAPPDHALGSISDPVAATTRGSLTIEVRPNPTRSLSLRASTTEARTGDVIHFEATPLDASDQAIPEMPVLYAFNARTSEHELGEPSSGVIADDGRFVADLPGEYTVLAISGAHTARQVVSIRPRNAQREIELVGQGRVSDRYTSDLWVWEGTDGRDYALTGTWGADGHALMWDVTDPGSMVVVDTVRIDARTVNDVKVSAHGRVAALSREGASNRRNGIVILDVSKPQEGIRILARYDDQITGGVHNLFIYDDHIYSLNGGRRYDIINIEDPSNPYRVGRFELDTPGHAIHDVWVEDGIAYSSNWQDGVVAVDVGGGDRGGSPRNPVMLGSYAYPSGWNHAALPFYSESVGRFYMIAGDEAVMRGGTPGYTGEPERQDGFVHFIEWDDWNQPRQVAHY